MKNPIVGLLFLLVSSIIYGSALISASVYSRVLASDGGPGWDTRYGIFGTALVEVGTVPIILAISFGIIGVTIIVLSVKERQI
ncbi:phosphatase [Rossellomorea sp. AcN35-11]|nr:phosphatase [Rossellomorea aquimaris]WJV29624.1 phosphatase [Rossellomorea sp. AcN35-11]